MYFETASSGNDITSQMADIISINILPLDWLLLYLRAVTLASSCTSSLFLLLSFLSKGNAMNGTPLSFSLCSNVLRSQLVKTPSLE